MFTPVDAAVTVTGGRWAGQATFVGVGGWVGALVTVGVLVAVAIGVRVMVAVAVAVASGVEVRVGVLVDVGTDVLVAVASTVLVGVGVAVLAAEPQPVSAAPALIRPQAQRTPVPVTGEEVVRIRSTTSWFVAPGFCEKSKPARAETCGAAIEVPLK